MSVVDNKTVDGVALTDDKKGIILLITDHLEWKDEYQHLIMLQAKINAYISFLYKKKSKNRIIRINTGILSNMKQKIKEFYH